MKNESIPYGKHHLEPADIEALTRVLQGDLITQGPVVEDFGRELAEEVGARFAVPVSSGSAALHLAVMALGLKEGDEVITTPITFCASANAVLYEKATPVFVDIDEKTLNIDPARIEEKINSNTRAILPVDFRGHPAALPEIKRLADKYNLYVIEDAAHSLGSTYSYEGSHFSCGDCQHADLAILSFHPVKHITTGEGGCVLTNDESLYKRIFNLRKHGIDRREEMFDETQRIGPWVYEMEMLGYNYRITDFQCALGISQLKRLSSFKRRRRELVDRYNEAFKGIKEFLLPFEDKSVDSNFHLYAVQVLKNSRFDRYDLFQHLVSMNYQVMVHYIPVHLLKYYREKYGYKPGDFPVAERYYDRTLSLPLYPTLTNEQQDRFISVIHDFIKSS